MLLAWQVRDVTYPSSASAWLAYFSTQLRAGGIAGLQNYNMQTGLQNRYAHWLVPPTQAGSQRTASIYCTTLVKPKLQC